MKTIPIDLYSGSLYMQRTRNLPGIKTHIPPNQCIYPWYQINISNEGLVFVCACDAWVPFPVGHVMNFNSIEEIFNSKQAQEIQQSITLGEYKFCDTVHCPVASGLGLERKYDYVIQVGIDKSCNLQCPSCRKEMMFLDGEEFLNERLAWCDRIRDWIRQLPDANINLLLGSNGEVFASHLYKEILKTEFNSLVSYSIRTNGTLIKRHIDGLKFLPNLKEIEVSIDAASQAVYENVRRPAKWSNLLENLNYIIELRKTYNFIITGNFVIQRATLSDTISFIKFCQEREMSPSPTLLQDWYTFEDFDAECVHRPGDTNFEEFLKVIRDPIMRKLNPSWLTNYSNFLN
jgi:MoaA/NifB/PqqE/SkfB family radical SAM enzyme